MLSSIEFKASGGVNCFSLTAISGGGRNFDSQTDSAGTHTSWHKICKCMRMRFSALKKNIFFSFSVEWLLPKSFCFSTKRLLVSAFPRVIGSLWSLCPRTANQELCIYTHRGKHSDVCFRPGEKRRPWMLCPSYKPQYTTVCILQNLQTMRWHRHSLLHGNGAYLFPLCREDYHSLLYYCTVIWSGH